MLPIQRAIILRNQNRQNALNLRRRRQQLRGMSNPFDIPEARFIKLFRLNKRLARELIDIVRQLIPPRQSLKGLSVELKVMTALRFYATGSYQRCIGQEFYSALSQTAVQRCVQQVTMALSGIVDQFIRLPDTPVERNMLKFEFMHRWGFPGVVGVIDGFHVAILKPTVNEHLFINRKRYHSINVQMICDHEQKIRNIFPNFGGATHDSFIWRMSAAQEFMRTIRNRGERSWLIGDSGYPLQGYLMTPIRVPVNNAETRFNSAHVAARNIIERSIGLLKMRFRCLLKERACRYNPVFVCHLVRACAILHNMCVENNIPFNYEFNENDDDDNEDDPEHPAVNQEALNIRDNIVNTYFA